MTTLPGKKLVHFFRAMLAVALLTFLSEPALPQPAVTHGTIEGTVEDATGGLLPDATVTLLNLDTGFTRTGVTDTHGRFRAPLLAVGTYTVTVELDGFNTLVRKGIILTIGSTVTLPDLTLEVATVEENIVVTAPSPVVETTRSVQAATFEQRAIESLPIDSRDFQDFATLTPTVIRTYRDTLSMGGQKGIDTNITLDGMDFTNAFFGSATGQRRANQFVIAQEAVKEFQVLANGHSVEFGRSGGGVLNVGTKSGTNELRGSAFIFARDENLTSTLALPDGTEVPKSDFSQQQLGGSLGGPLVTDKAHYFIAIEQQFFDSPFSVKFSRHVSGVPPLQQLYGQPIAGVDDLASLEGTFKQETKLSGILGKIDIQTSRSNALSFRYNFSRLRGINSGASAGGVQGSVQVLAVGGTEDITVTSHSIAVSNTTVMGSNKFNELRFQYSFEDRRRFGTSDETPSVLVRDCCKWGRTASLPITNEQTRIQVTDNFSYLFGNHDLKFGADINLTNTKQAFFGFSGGEWQFNTLEDFLAGRPRSFAQLVGLNGFSTRESGTRDLGQSEYAFYIQDVFKPTPGLTLNFGLRWEGLDNPEVPTEEFGKPTRNPLNPGEVFGLDQQAVNDDFNNWAPRLGFAWDPRNDGRTVFRGGAGIYYSRTPLLLLTGPYSNGFRSATIFVTRDFDKLPFDFPGIFPETGLAPGDPLVASLPPSDIFFWAPDFQNPQIQRANLGFEREVAPNFSLGVDYVYAHTIHSQRQRDLNLDPPFAFDSYGRGLYSSGTGDRPDPRFSSFAFNESTGNGRYQALILAAKKRQSKNLLFQLYYTLSNSESDDDNERDGRIGPSQPENFGVDWGPNHRDVRHRFVGSAVIDLAAGFQIAATIQANSGRPFSVFSGMDDNGDGIINDRAVIDDTNRARVEAAGQNLDDGLQGRNTARQPGEMFVDIRVTKAFELGSAGRLELMFDVFNLFNNANRSTHPGLTQIRSPSFGQLNLIGPSRQAQIGIRWRF